MKKRKGILFRLLVLFTLLCMQLFLSLHCFGISSGLTIINYYRKLPPNLLRPKKYDLKYIKSEKYGSYWSIRIPRLGNIPITVDIKNGFISIYKSGSGWNKQQIVLFRDNQGRNYIGISYINSGGFSATGSRLNFYSYENGKWTDVTSRVLIDIPYEKYFYKKSSRIKVKQVMQVLKRISLFQYILPRFGLTLKIRIITQNIKNLIKHRKSYFLGDKNNVKISELDLKLLKSFLKEIKHEEIVLKWNVAKGRFDCR